MKMNLKDILANNEIITKDDILTINYTTATGKGCFKILMPAKFPTTAAAMKIFIDMFFKAEDPEAEARPLYDYLTKCVEALKDFRELAKKAGEPGEVAQVTAEIKKYNANIEVICKYFKFEAAEDPEAVKLQKVEVVKQGTKNGKKFVENRTGKKFVKYGHTFHVYKEPKGDCYIIIPCCGIAALAYNGGIAEAPEHITKDLITKLDKLNFKELNTAFIEVIEGAENIILNNDISVIYNDENKEVATAEKTEAPEVTQNETIINMINVKYNNHDYTITCDCTNNYIISAGIDWIILTPAGDLLESSHGIADDTKILLYGVFKAVKHAQKLPIYETTAPATTEATEDKPRPRAEVTTAPPRPQPPVYIAMVYYGFAEAMNHATTGDSTPASLKRANIPPRPNKRHITPYSRRQQPNKGILYHYNAIQWHYSPAGLYSGINRHIATLQDYTRAYHAQTAPPGLYATGDSLKAGIICAQTMPNLSYHDTC